MRFFSPSHKDTFIDNLFRFTVYLISIYFINYNKYNINIIGYVILLSHFYKDAIDMKKWPIFTDYIGLFMGGILIYEGYQLEECFLLLIGIIKFFGHIRQLIKDDDRFYY